MEKNENQINQLIVSTLEKFKNIVSVDSVVGSPMTLPDGTTLIPFSKVSAGFVSGGGEYDAKNTKDENHYPFSGGGGSGYCISPIGVISVKLGQVKMIKFDGKNAFDKLFEIVPSLISSLKEGGNDKK